MTQPINRRRALAATSSLLAGGALFAAASPVYANQPHMEKALGYLHLAQEELRKATANKGGHRVEAINIIDRAVRQVRQGIRAAES